MSRSVILCVLLLFVHSVHGFISDRVVLLHLNRLGLANRLRALADWYQVARLSQRTLLLSWAPSPDCNAHFHDLFEDGPEGLQVLKSSLPDSAAAIAKFIATEQKYTFESLPDEVDFLVNRTLLTSSINILYTDHNGVVALEGVKCQHHLYLRSQFYRSLVPVATIRETVDSIRKEHFQSRLVVGVHIRTHDPMFDWAVIPPVGAGQHAAEFGSTATTFDFHRQMSNIVEKFHDQVLFFIASNSRDVRIELQGVYPHAIALDDTPSRETTDGIIVALIEWLLLSESALILHTYGSSFAMEAAQVHQIPVLGLWGGIALQHSHAMLPYCGHTQYLRTTSAQGIATSYEEGTTDRRRVDGKAIAMMPCNYLKEWGVINVYCSVDDDDAKLIGKDKL